jgi:hypothetical protein
MISIATCPGVDYPDASEFFSPSTAYPEYGLGHLSTRPNPVYDGVRRLFAEAGLDAARFGSREWNPLGAHVRPGSSVFVLCNFVYHRRSQESPLDFAAKCIHGSVLRPVLDYLLLAVGPAGRVTFGNAPLQSCVWSRVLEETGASRVAEFYRSRSRPVAAKDLRLYVVERDLAGRTRKIERRDAPGEGVDVDLGRESLLAALGDGTTHFRVSNYDPARTESHHRDGAHRYIINRAVLEADTVVSLCKLKTHEKVGITCGLKGFVGTVAHKDCLAHHRFGGPKVGGDEYPRSTPWLHATSRFHDWVNRESRAGTLHGLQEFLDRSLRFVLRRLGVPVAGAWYGNDTCWRMAVDLARIVHYADRSGVMRDTVQREHLVVVDGIVGGEGSGPLAPRPVHSGVLVYGDSVVPTDRVACRLMGYDPDRIALVREARRPMAYPLVDTARAQTIRLDGVELDENSVRSALGRPFAPPPGWASYPLSAHPIAPAGTLRNDAIADAG